MKETMSSIYEIAKITKVTPSTVSKVLNNRYGVSSKTKEKILKVIKQYNFSPKIGVYKESSIGVVLFYTTNFFKSYYVQEIMNGICDTAFKYDLDLNIIPSFHIQKNIQNLSSYLRKQQISGLILLHTHRDEPLASIISQEKIPHVVLSNIFENKKINWIASNNREGVKEATQYLIKLGHKRIGFVTGDINMSDSYERWQGYIEALKTSHSIITTEERQSGPESSSWKESNSSVIVNKKPHSELVSEYRLSIQDKLHEKSQLQIDESLICKSSGYEIEDGYNEVKKLLLLQNPPTAIITGGDRLVIGALEAIKERGLNIPYDISLIAAGEDNPYFTVTKPQISVVKQDLFQMGSLAIEKLRDLINSGNSKNSNFQIILDTKFIIRDSITTYKKTNL